MTTLDIVDNALDAEIAKCVSTCVVNYISAVTPQGADKAIDTLDSAIKTIEKIRGKIHSEIGTP